MTEWRMAAVSRARAEGTWDGKPYMVVADEHIEGLAAELRPYPKAFESYAGFSPSTKRQYAGCYYEAKKEDTRKRRLPKVVELIEANKRLM